MNPNEFWTGSEGDEYIKRNRGGIAPRLALWSRVLANTRGVDSVLEFGANIGLNIDAIAMLLPPHVLFYAVEPNQSACEQINEMQICDGLVQSTIAGYGMEYKADLVFTRGVLIHTPPEDLDESYSVIYKSSNRYICFAEYYSPRREMIAYRGQDNLLWRGDFAGEMMSKFPDLKLVDYFFVSKHDPNFPQDDITVWLMEKTANAEITCRASGPG